MSTKRCHCIGNTHLYGHNSGCPLNPMTTTVGGCLIPILLGIIIGTSLLAAGVKV